MSFSEVKILDAGILMLIALSIDTNKLRTYLNSTAELVGGGDAGRYCTDQANDCQFDDGFHGCVRCAIVV